MQKVSLEMVYQNIFIFRTDCNDKSERKKSTKVITFFEQTILGRKCYCTVKIS